MNKDYMLRMKPKTTGVLSPAKASSSAGGGGSEVSTGWEVRPIGMLVQRRSSDTIPVSNIKVEVKYGSSYHEIILNSQATFGDLKKMLTGPNGLRPSDQKLIYKEKERDSKTFLDIAGVKDGSKIVLIEDELSKERRLLESCKNVKMEKASKDIAAIKFEVDNLAKQVESIELEINRGKKVVEIVLSNLIELLMMQLIKLDGIYADGDVKLQRKMQVKMVQKYIETLDMLKLRNNCGEAKVALQQQQNKLVFGEFTKPARREDQECAWEFKRRGLIQSQ